MGHLIPTWFQKIADDLRSPGSVNFRLQLLEAKTLSLNVSQKEECIWLVVAKIQKLLELWNFKDLAWAQDFLVYLWGESIVRFDDAWTQKLKTLYEDRRIHLQLLIDMFPSLYNGRIGKVKEFVKVEFARELLLQYGFSESELTQDFLEHLRKLREILIYMRYNQIHVEQVLQAYLEVVNLWEGDASRTIWYI